MVPMCECVSVCIYLYHVRKREIERKPWAEPHTHICIHTTTSSSTLSIGFLCWYELGSLMDCNKVNRCIRLHDCLGMNFTAGCPS